MLLLLRLLPLIMMMMTLMSILCHYSNRCLYFLWICWRHIVTSVSPVDSLQFQRRSVSVWHFTLLTLTADGNACRLPRRLPYADEQRRCSAWPILSLTTRWAYDKKRFHEICYFLTASCDTRHGAALMASAAAITVAVVCDVSSHTRRSLAGSVVRFHLCSTTHHMTDILTRYLAQHWRCDALTCTQVC